VAGRYLFGTQGWDYPGWAGAFYPHGTRSGDMLGFYARAFPTVELDATFYAIPAEPVVAAWREQSPPGFTFALKVPQEITHERRLADVDQRLARFLKRVSGLGDRLGPLLIQLSPDFRSTESTRGVLQRFLRSLPGEFRWAIEFRQPQWLTTEILDLLRSAKVALALVDSRWIKRGVVLDVALETTADFAYVRWSGPARKGVDVARTPVDRTRETTVWAEALRGLGERVGTVFGYFSNQFQAHAPASARLMQKAMGIDPVEPSMLREQAELF
jgi:uncharacterized protein YecE (DUF72 family)